MSNNAKDQSGPAFPVENVRAENTRQGMTKRELIAMGQMKAWRSHAGPVATSEAIARFAIQDADALLAELGRE